LQQTVGLPVISAHNHHILIILPGIDILEMISRLNEFMTGFIHFPVCDHLITSPRGKEPSLLKKHRQHKVNKIALILNF